MKKADRIYFGGDYNPDQWDEATIDEDMRLFQKAHINLVVLPVFSWAKIEPDEGVYHFEWLDKILNKLWANGIRVCLATPTGAQPAWLSKRYPEVLPVDIGGRKRTHGMRVFFCYNSLKYRERAGAIAGEMAKRYKDHPALAAWHIANEYGTYCYCETCRAEFRKWLRERYGTIENLNNRWNTAFWGRIVYQFDEIELPTELNDDYRFNPSVQLDYMRFVTDSTARCFLNEYQVLKQYTPDIPIYTNISGFIKKLDQRALVKHMDVVGWDNYPGPKDDPGFVAMKHDIMRGLRDGQSFYLAEQSPNQQNWQPYNKLKRPGEVRLFSYQAMAHGADTCFFFQMRQSVAGQEKFHGAVITHAGHENTRVFKEITALGKELEKIGDLFLESWVHSSVGILFDWNNWWALELSSGPSRDMNYLQSVFKYYKGFYQKNIPVDMLAVDSDWSQYKVLVAPLLYMIKDGVAERIIEFVRGGGIFIATTMTGLVDENDRAIFGEYPGKLKELLGIWVEETDALFPDEKNTIVVEPNTFLPASRYECGFLCDIIHPRGAKVLGRYGEDFYQDTPCITVNSFGEGTAYYIGTEPEDALISDLIFKIMGDTGIKPIYDASKNVEITKRVLGAKSVVFVINHNHQEAVVDFEHDVLWNVLDDKKVTGKTVIGPRDVMILQKK